jgi:gentisate 1,2-dioxygenase
LNATVTLFKPAVTDVIFGARGAVTVAAPAGAPFEAPLSPVATITTPQSQVAQPRGRARPLDVPIMIPLLAAPTSVRSSPISSYRWSSSARPGRVIVQTPKGKRLAGSEMHGRVPITGRARGDDNHPCPHNMHATSAGTRVRFG